MIQHLTPDFSLLTPNSSRLTSHSSGGPEITIRSAIAKDRRALMGLLRENGMEHAEPIGDYLLAVQGENLLGCIRLEECETVSMIRPVVVSQRYRKKGIGRLLVESILPVGKPKVVAARGEAVSFYRSLGFVETIWDFLPESQMDECRSCPDQKACQPQPMAQGLTAITHVQKKEGRR